MTNIPSWARVGAKCVCTFDFSSFITADEVVPKKGEIYTISEIVVISDNPGFRFSEIVNKPNQYKDGVNECAFYVNCFRPLITRTLEQDMEIFAPLLEMVDAR